MLLRATVFAAFGLTLTSPVHSQTATEVFALLEQQQIVVDQLGRTLTDICVPLHMSQQSVASLAQQHGLEAVPNPNKGRSQTFGALTLTPPDQAWRWAGVPNLVVAEEHVVSPGVHGCNIAVAGVNAAEIALAAKHFADDNAMVARRVNAEAVIYTTPVTRHPVMMVSELGDAAVVSFVGKVGQDGG